MLLRDYRIHSGNFSDTSVMRVVSTLCSGWNPRTGPAGMDRCRYQKHHEYYHSVSFEGVTVHTSARDLDGQFHGSHYTTVTFLFFFFFFCVSGLREFPALISDSVCSTPTHADGRIILRWIFRKWEGVVRTGWSWIRIGTGGGHLWVRWWTFGFQKCGEFLD